MEIIDSDQETKENKYATELLQCTYIGDTKKSIHETNVNQMTFHDIFC